MWHNFVIGDALEGRLSAGGDDPGDGGGEAGGLFEGGPEVLGVDAVVVGYPCVLPVEGDAAQGHVVGVASVQSDLHVVQGAGPLEPEGDGVRRGLPRNAAPSMVLRPLAPCGLSWARMVAAVSFMGVCVLLRSSRGLRGGV